VAKGNGL